MKEYTHICIVLDASGSMAAIENDIKGSFNTFIRTQRETEGKTVFDLYQFSDEVKRIVEHVDLATFTDDLMAKYTCSGCTALNDAVCTAIDTLGKELGAMREDDRPEHVVFVIITDGMENASRKFTSEDVKKRISVQRDSYKWDFQFLAANQDAFESGRTLGIDRDSCTGFISSSRGVASMCCFLSDHVERVKKHKK